nr:MAG TPA: hypothetical protein [Caudoviricetes sp.]
MRFYIVIYKNPIYPHFTFELCLTILIFCM